MLLYICGWYIHIHHWLYVAVCVVRRVCVCACVRVYTQCAYNGCMWLYVLFGVVWCCVIMMTLSLVLCNNDDIAHTMVVCAISSLSLVLCNNDDIVIMMILRIQWLYVAVCVVWCCVIMMMTKQHIQIMTIIVV